MTRTAKVCVQCDGWGKQNGCATRSVKCQSCRGTGIVYVPTPAPVEYRFLFTKDRRHDISGKG